MMKTCCFCCSLKTGCMCIAIYNLIGSILSFLVYIGCLIYGNYLWNWDSLAVGIILGDIYFIGPICLLHGLKKKTSSLLLTWVILSLMRLLAEIGVVIFIGGILAKLRSFPTNNLVEGTRNLAYVVSVPLIIMMSVMCLDILFTMYCMHAVNSYRIKMETTDNDDIPAVGYQVPAYMEKIDDRV